MASMDNAIHILQTYQTAQDECKHTAFDDIKKELESKGQVYERWDIKPSDTPGDMILSVYGEDGSLLTSRVMRIVITAQWNHPDIEPSQS